MEENIFDKIKNTVCKPEPKTELKQVTKISDIKLTENSKHKTFTLDNESTALIYGVKNISIA